MCKTVKEKPANSVLVLDAGGLCYHLSPSMRLTPKAITNFSWSSPWFGNPYFRSLQGEGGAQNGEHSPPAVKLFWDVKEPPGSVSWFERREKLRAWQMPKCGCYTAGPGTSAILSSSSHQPPGISIEVNILTLCITGKSGVTFVLTGLCIQPAVTMGYRTPSKPLAEDLAYFRPYMESPVSPIRPQIPTLLGLCQPASKQNPSSTPHPNKTKLAQA